MISFYVLQLENGKYYIGQSSDPGKRISKHFKGKGAAWTREYKPIKVFKQWGSTYTDWKIAEREECRITIEYMVKYGWENVRGGYWSHISEEQTYKKLLQHKEFISSLGFDLRDFVT